MISQFRHATFGTPSAPSTVNVTRRKRFGKRLYALFGVIAVAVIAVALLIPQGAATLPLNVEYAVGEKLIYETVETITNELSNTSTEGMPTLPSRSVTLSWVVTEEVVGFDGEFYVLNHTMNSEIQGKQHSLSFLQKMNKTGYSSTLLPEGNEAVVSNSSGNPIVTAVLERPEVQVGENWEIPLNVGNSNSSMTGTLTLTFGGIQEITVPAGTYTVFRVDTSGSDIVMNLNGPVTNMNVSRTVIMNQQIYLEYGSCKQIQASMQSVITNTYHDTGMVLVSNIATQTTLTEHINP